MRTVLLDYKLDPPEYPDPPGCPVCGSTEYAEIYKGEDGVVGCDVCVRCISAEEWWGNEV